MKTFRIENIVTGTFLGEYHGRTGAEALDAMARDCGVRKLQRGVRNRLSALLWVLGTLRHRGCVVTVVAVVGNRDRDNAIRKIVATAPSHRVRAFAADFWDDETEDCSFESASAYELDIFVADLLIAAIDDPSLDAIRTLENVSSLFLEAR